MLWLRQLLLASTVTDLAREEALAAYEDVASILGMSQQEWVDTYVTGRLYEEARSALKAKGIDDPSGVGIDIPASVVPPSSKKDGASTMKQWVEQLQAQRIQQSAVSAWQNASPSVEMWVDGDDLVNPVRLAVACGRQLYHTFYPGIAGCSPGRAAKCSRVVLDGVLSVDEIAVLQRGMDTAFQGLFFNGGEQLLAVDADSLLRFPAVARHQIGRTIARVRKIVEDNFAVSGLHLSGSLFKRWQAVAPEGAMQLNHSHDPSLAHVDKANIPSYDYSALLYLSSHNNDFGGGTLAFLDPSEKDQIVIPRAGRLILFSSGVENLHRVDTVTWGERSVFALWFTCSKDHAGEGDLLASGQADNWFLDGTARGWMDAQTQQGGFHWLDSVIVAALVAALLIWSDS